MAKNNELCTHRKRSIIAWETVKGGVSEQNKTKKLTTSLSQFRNISSEDSQHKETQKLIDLFPQDTSPH